MVMKLKTLGLALTFMWFSPCIYAGGDKGKTFVRAVEATVTKKVSSSAAKAARIPMRTPVSAARVPVARTILLRTPLSSPSSCVAKPTQTITPHTVPSFTPLNQVTAVGEHKVPGVYPLTNSSGQTVAYAKVGPVEEITRTRQIGKLLEDNKIISTDTHLEIDYPHLLGEDLSALPVAVQKTITQDIANLPKSRTSKGVLVRENQHRVFVMSVADTQGMSLGDMNMLKMDIQDEAWLQASPSDYLNQQMNSALLTYLNGHPITRTEWEEVKNLVKDLNKAGFEHGDLGQNLFIRRNPQTGQLKITLIDFEISPGNTPDLTILSRWEALLQQYQVLIP